MAKTFKISNETWEEIAVGTALLCAVGWLIAKAMQAASTVPDVAAPAPLPVAASAQVDGQQFYWPGMYGGSTPAGIPAGSTIAGLSPLVIPDMSPITYPPVSQAFQPNAPSLVSGNVNSADAGCGCAAGFIGQSAPAVAAMPVVNAAPSYPALQAPPPAPARPQYNFDKLFTPPRSIGSFSF